MSITSAKPQLTSWISLLGIYLAGMCMGVADIIPGISGGTIAFILGVYPDLILSLNSFNKESLSLLFSLRLREFFRSVGWEFLLALGFGIATSLALLAGLIDAWLNQVESRSFLYAGFSGLVLASVLFFLKEIQVWRVGYILLFFIGAGAAFFLTVHFEGFSTEELYAIPYELPSSEVNWASAYNYNAAAGDLEGVKLQTLALMHAKGLIADSTSVTSMNGSSAPAVLGDLIVFASHSWIQPFLFLSGVLAISAALLPGISGSYVLTIIGIYPLIIGALADFVAALKRFSWDQDAFIVMLNFALGVFFGALLFARFIRWLFDRGPDYAISLLTGFMLGAMPAVWPFWHYHAVINPLKTQRGLELIPSELYFPEFNSLFFWQALGCAVVGFGVLFLLEQVSKKSFSKS